MPPPSSSDATPESLFASWLERVESGEEASLDDLCQRHPRHEAALRDLQRRWLEFQGVWEPASESRGRGAGGSGSEGDPHSRSPIASGGSERVDLSSELLSRLQGKPPASTRYRVQDEVAHGGMGAVRLVWDEELRRPLAMKVMHGQASPSAASDTPGSDPRQLARFLEEAQITGRLDHPGIVPVHELGLDADGRVFFTMKLVEGRTLREVFDELARGEEGWSQARVLGLVLRVCEAMAYAHAKGVIHRDLKPSNVMVGKFGEVYVMDWGLAKVLGHEDGRDLRVRPGTDGPGEEARGEDAPRVEDTPSSPLLTMDGDVIGTPAYMPPEQARGDLEAMGPQSDVYAVGAMLYHLLGGRMPYVGPEERPSSRAIWRRVREGPPRPLRAVAPRTPAELTALCEKAMARDPRERYPDMSALAADLTAFLEGRVVAAYEAGAWAEAKKWVRRNRPLAAAIAAVALAVLVGGVAFAVKANEAGQRATDVLRLSALSDVEELLERVQSTALWPAHPDRIDALEGWIGEARTALAELPSFEAKLRELRALALEPSPEDVEREVAAHPDHARLTAELESRRSALERRRSTNPEPAPSVDLDPAEVPGNPQTIREQAWWRVWPGRRTRGQEEEGLALARLAKQIDEGTRPLRRANIEYTIALGLFALGLDDEALTASRRALELAPSHEEELFVRYLAEVEAAVEEARSPNGLLAAADEIERLERERTELEERIHAQRILRFSAEHAEARWWSERLVELVGKLELLGELLAEDALVPDLGWSVPKRLAFARDLEAGFAEGGAHARLWADAREELRAAYPGLDVPPQMGLVPLGPDPDSGLWEFAHLMTGTPPRRASDGRLELDEDMALVLVLLPGGEFWMGAQKSHPKGWNYDPFIFRSADEGPVHEVRLSPFFVSKFEMTQGQWLRLTGSNPSVVRPRGSLPLLHPAEFVSWRDGVEWLTRAGLALPSEAQWEYAARGGMQTPWFTGADLEFFAAAAVANLWDEVAAREKLPMIKASKHDLPPMPADGFKFHAPVGSFAGNPFGLHDVLGNLQEFCLDAYDGSFYHRSPWLDPVCSREGQRVVVVRGGSFGDTPFAARSAYRSDMAIDAMGSKWGLRPARPLQR